ncbi:hypothetical protein G3N57_04305 [Paraburkholderia sp. Se-20369]|nr:hypothetical protein [Paraburkholderia sp. Se-20369]
MHELTTPFALRTARALMDVALALAYADPRSVAREAADRARRVMEIEAGSNVSTYSAAERLMYFAGDIRWLSAALYDERDTCRVPMEQLLPPHRLPAAHELSRLAWEIVEAESKLTGARQDDRRRMDQESALRYLVRRLESVDCDDTRNAAKMVRGALEVSAQLESEFYDSLWADVTRALDRRAFAPEHRDLLSALEVELAGHVYGLRLAEGKLVRREFVHPAQPQRRGLLRRLLAN